APTLGDSLPQSIRIRFSVHTTGNLNQAQNDFAERLIGSIRVSCRSDFRDDVFGRDTFVHFRIPLEMKLQNASPISVGCSLPEPRYQRYAQPVIPSKASIKRCGSIASSIAPAVLASLMICRTPARYPSAGLARSVKSARLMNGRSCQMTVKNSWLVRIVSIRETTNDFSFSAGAACSCCTERN